MSIAMRFKKCLRSSHVTVSNNMIDVKKSRGEPVGSNCIYSNYLSSVCQFFYNLKKTFCVANQYVDFISDVHFKKCVKHVVDAYNKEFILEDKQLQKNGIDTIKMTFDMLCEENDFKKWKIKESTRQKDKTVNNALGEFHQMLLGGVDGWTDLGAGDITKLDLKKNDNSIFMELKNKDNTVNADSSAKVREKLLVQIKKHNAIGYFAYFVATNGRSEELDWKSANLENHKNLRRLSGTKVYEIVTGKHDALEQIWKALPSVLKDIHHITNPLSENEKIEFKKWFKLAYNK